MRAVALSLAIPIVCLVMRMDAALARCEDHVPGPKPQNASRDIVGQSLDEIVERGYIEFAVYEEFPPYSWREDGAAKGVDIAVGRLVADFLGVEARFRFVAAAEDVDGEAAALVGRGEPRAHADAIEMVNHGRHGGVI